MFLGQLLKTGGLVSATMLHLSQLGWAIESKRKVNSISKNEVSLLMSALVVRADKLRSSIEVLRAVASSPIKSPVNSVFCDSVLVLFDSAIVMRVLPASAVYWFTKIAAASSKASCGLIDVSVSMVKSNLSRSVAWPTRVFSTL